jgi:hypothetical protein
VPTKSIMKSCPQGFIRVGEILCDISVFQHCKESSVPALEEKEISTPECIVSVPTETKYESDDTEKCLSESIFMMRSQNSSNRDPQMLVVLHNGKMRRVYDPNIAAAFKSSHDSKLDILDSGTTSHTLRN